MIEDKAESNKIEDKAESNEIENQNSNKTKPKPNGPRKDDQQTGTEIGKKPEAI